MKKWVTLVLIAIIICTSLLACRGYIQNPLSRRYDYEGLGLISKNKIKIQQIKEEEDLYPDRLLEALDRNPEIIEFALDYPEKQGTSSDVIDLADKLTDDKIPLLMQWDKEWGYASYGKGIIGLDGCGPTCLSMVAVGLTGDLNLNPKVVAAFSEENGYLDRRTDTTLWTLMTEGAEKLGLKSRELPLDENSMIKELSQEHPIICSMGPGDFTTTGHFIVLYGYEEGEFIIGDPNSTKRSRKRWTYSELKPQIKNLWVFSK